MRKQDESEEEATITKWFVKVGDTVEEDQVLLEIATDKVDSEIPSPVAGVIKEIRYEVNALVPVGEVIAVVSLDGSGVETPETPKAEKAEEAAAPAETKAEAAPAAAISDAKGVYSGSVRSNSTLDKCMAKHVHMSQTDS